MSALASNRVTIPHIWELRLCAKRRHSRHQTYYVEGDYGLEEALELELFDRIPRETRPPGRRNAGSGRLGMGVAFVPVQFYTFFDCFDHGGAES
jgi:hypothetical protein